MSDPRTIGSPDSILLREVAATVAATRDLCTAAAAGTTLDGVHQLCRTAAGQLEVTARLLRAIRRGEIMDAGAAAATGFSLPVAAPAPSDFQGRD